LEDAVAGKRKPEQARVAVTRAHREAWARKRYGDACVDHVPEGCVLHQWLTQTWLYKDNWRSCTDDERGAQVIAEAEQRERFWWSNRIAALAGAAEEERYGGGPVVHQGELVALLEERVEVDKQPPPRRGAS
jgi:hypothetical protein